MLSYSQKALGVEKVETSGLLLAAGAVVAGVATCVLGASGVFKALPVPSWSVYVAGIALVLAGIAIAYLFGKKMRCLACGGEWEFFETYYSLESEADVRRAVEGLDVAALLRLSPVPKAQMKMEVCLNLCTGCQRTGDIQLAKWQDFQHHVLRAEQDIEGDGVAQLIALGRQHDTFRDELEDEGDAQ